jgi:hypothetical protein
MTGFNSKRDAAADKQHWNEDEWRRNNWRCGHGWLRGEQCEICNAAQPAQDGKCKYCVDGCIACDARAQPAQEPDALTIAYQSGFYDGKKVALAQPVQKPINLLEARKIAAEYGTPDLQIDSGNLYFALMKCLEHIDAQPAQDVDYWIREATAARQAEMAMRRELEAQPAQEPVAFESFLESQDFYELMQTYRHCLTDALLPFEEVKDALRAAHIGSKP